MDQAVQQCPSPRGFRAWGDRGALIERILNSATFRRSPRIREFLSYVAAHAFEDDFDSITEQQIGVAVFQRRADYNPGDDSVVRVQAHHLRKKLAEYFAGEGADEPEVVEIPKGGYVPVFRPREVVTPTPPGAPIPQLAAPASTAHLGGRLYMGALLCLAAFAAGLFTQLIWPGGEEAPVPIEAAAFPSAPTGYEPAPNPILGRVLVPEQPTMLFMEDMALLLAYSLRDRNEFIDLEEYRQGTFRSSAAGVLGSDLPVRRLAGHVRRGRHVDFANAQFAFSLAQAYPTLCRNVTVRYPQDIHIRDLKMGNCIFLGGTSVNPWVELYEDRLNFRLRYFSEKGGGFENREPRPGEPSVYGEMREGERTYYARVALLPNLDTGYATLILTGHGSTATEAATEFILKPDAAELLPSPLRAALDSGARQVEILLEVTRVLGAPHRVEVAAWRAER